MTPGCLPDITGVISPCWTRQGLSSHAFLWHFSSLSRLRDSVTLGLETVGTLYCALHQYNAGPAERVENLTLACARTHQPHWPLGETDTTNHNPDKLWPEGSRRQESAVRNCVHTNTFYWERVDLWKKSKRKERKRRSVIVSIQFEEPFIDCLGLDLVTSAV